MNQLLEYFERTVLRFPKKTAVACREERYSFAKLRDLSRRLGERIAACGWRDRSIGVWVDRGIDTAAFFLAVLYSGNFYVPIDPDMPQEKLEAILADADPKMILCREEDREILRDLQYDGLILTMADAAESEAVSAGEWQDEREAEDTVAEKMADGENHLPDSDTPAYMIYTSGSTGRPKGVLKSCGAVIDFMETYIQLFDLGEDEIIGNQTPFFFDASAKDFYQMLFTGATLEILPSELFVFPKLLIEYLNERAITYICWVPTALSAVTQLNTFREVIPTTVKKVFFVGEKFPEKQLQKWMQTLPELTYVNLYGSTELAGVCCYDKLPVPFEGTQGIPLGRALPNCQVFLRAVEEDTEEAKGQDIPQWIGEPDTVGEICVVSDSLALGYYHDPERTADTFVSLTLPDGTTARVLRTGDLGRYDAEGKLYFVSRTDDQIKHTGHRIELGEIETVAYRFPEIAKCCCLYDDRKRRICLFCELSPGCEWDGKRIRHELSDRLSEYMLPSKYYILDKLPLNANGKADRVRLKEML